MNILLTGINHKTAPVEMREQLAIEPGRLTDAVDDIFTDEVNVPPRKK